MDPFILCTAQPLFLHEQLFIQLFARPETGIFDLDIHPGFETGQLNQILCQIRNLHRLSHIQYKNLAALRTGAGLKYERNRLGDRHEIPDNIRMCHGNRTACRDLLLEKRDHASVAPQHISKTDRNIFRIGAVVEHLNDHLTDPLGGTHDIGRIDRLICRDQHKLLRIISICRKCNLVCTEYIILDCFVGAVLHQRHMLMRRRMVYDIRPVS